MSLGILSTYPPTQCGLATFSRALVESLQTGGDEVGVVRLVDADELPSVVGHAWVRGTRGGAEAAAAALDGYDVAVIQHEYGIFPGRDGEEVLSVVRALRVPVITVLHTVLVTPSDHQREILLELARYSDVLVTMTETARQRLVAHYAIDPAQVEVIPHGAAQFSADRGSSARGRAGRAPVILTWGLLGEGKGIEWAIDAMRELADLRPRPEYWVVGETHPKVRAQHGEAYRDQLIERAGDDLGRAVHFDDHYLTTAELHQRIHRADVVLLPYDSREQVTSGVLIEAVTAGKPVISTGFPHAVELLASGAGLIVERRDPASIAAALRRVLTDPALAARMTAEATRIAPDLLWPAVGDRYRQIARRATAIGAVRASA